MVSTLHVNADWWDFTGVNYPGAATPSFALYMLFFLLLLLTWPQVLGLLPLYVLQLVHLFLSLRPPETWLKLLCGSFNAVCVWNTSQTKPQSLSVISAEWHPSFLTPARPSRPLLRSAAAERHFILWRFRALLYLMTVPSCPTVTTLCTAPYLHASYLLPPQRAQQVDNTQVHIPIISLLFQ